MFGDIGWAELVLIGIVALIVIGPEDLPDMFRQLGRFTAKLRQMSREFSRAMEDAARQSGVKDVADDLKTMTSAKSLGLNKVREAADRFEKWDPIKQAARGSAAKTLVPPAMPPTTPPADAAAAAAAEPLPPGPAVQALRDKNAAKKAVLAETAARLKAIDAGAAGAIPAASDTPKAARRPRAPRKPKADANGVDKA